MTILSLYITNVHIILKKKKPRQLFSEIPTISEAHRARKKFVATVALNSTELIPQMIRKAELRQGRTALRFHLGTTCQVTAGLHLANIFPLNFN